MSALVLCAVLTSYNIRMPDICMPHSTRIDSTPVVHPVELYLPLWSRAWRTMHVPSKQQVRPRFTTGFQFILCACVNLLLKESPEIRIRSLSNVHFTIQKHLSNDKFAINICGSSYFWNDCALVVECKCFWGYVSCEWYRECDRRVHESFRFSCHAPELSTAFYADMSTHTHTRERIPSYFTNSWTRCSNDQIPAKTVGFGRGFDQAIFDDRAMSICLAKPEFENLRKEMISRWSEEDSIFCFRQRRSAKSDKEKHSATVALKIVQEICIFYSTKIVTGPNFCQLIELVETGEISS